MPMRTETQAAHMDGVASVVPFDSGRPSGDGVGFDSP